MLSLWLLITINKSIHIDKIPLEINHVEQNLRTVTPSLFE